MNRSLLVIFMMTLLLIWVVPGQAEQISPTVKDAAKNIAGDPPIEMPPAAKIDRVGELDEIVGDTLIVGWTFRDMQHNGTLGHMLTIDNDFADVTGYRAHFTWTFRSDPIASSRAVYRAVDVDDAGNMSLVGAGYANIDSDWGAYQVINVVDSHDSYIVSYHGPDPGDPNAYAVTHAVPSPFIPGFYNLYYVPVRNDTQTLWPHSVGTVYNDTYYVHSMTNGFVDDGTEDNLYYNRSVYDPVSASFQDDMPGPESQELVTTYAMNLSNATAASDDGSKVALSHMISRYTLLGEGGDWDGLAMSQANNDVYIWESEDGGLTWDWDLDNAINVTNWIAPDENLLPDTTAANNDTLRAYTEIALDYDADNTIHVAFTTPEFDFFREISYFASRIFYWNNEHEMYSQIADGSFFNNTGGLPVWERVAGNPAIYADDSFGPAGSDLVWAAFVRFGDEGDTLTTGDNIGAPFDASDENMQASDVYVTASPNNGLHWAMPVNITNTRTMEWGLLPYETKSEREMTIAANSDGDWLHLLYTIDYDPGVAVPGDPGVGEPTENDVVYHRVAKQELIDLFEANGEWQRNYPMHVDSTGFFQSGDDWTWSGFWNPDALNVGEGEQLQPNEFKLEQNYPNPFNPSTQIEFSLETAGQIKLAVYDVLGREVATLVNRNMNAGRHHVTFTADNLTSGVYFYKLTSGDVSKVRKMVLMK